MSGGFWEWLPPHPACLRYASAVDPPPPGEGEGKWSRRFRQSLFGFGITPIQPQHQRLEIALFDRRAAPDPQSRNRVAMIDDVIGDTFLLEKSGQILDE